MDGKRTQDLRYSQYSTQSYRDGAFSHNSQVDPNRQMGSTVSNALSFGVKANTVDTISSRPRMSLLPHSNDLVQYRGNQHSSSSLSESNAANSCLRIDTREYVSSTGAYHPMVEAISPTNEDTSNSDELGNVKSELISQMNKINSEITETEKTINMLKKKQELLEETASLKSDANVEEYSELPSKHRSLAQKIYAENKKKAIQAHAIFNKLGPMLDFPLYNQPQDSAACREIKKFHVTFKERLKSHLTRLKQQQAKSRFELVENYSKLSFDWNRRLEKLENNVKRKAREAKSREFFEKVFPELRKQREDKERFNRVGSRIKSEADVEEIIDGLQEQALEDKKMRSYAVIPPLVLSMKERNLNFINENGAFGNMEKELKDHIYVNVWTSGEEEVFREKFLQHPKNFGAIAANLDRKSAQDCVRHYYLSKKRENYKQLLRKSRQRTRSSRNPHKASQNITPSIIDAMTTGVVTRLQREQQKTVTKDRSNVVVAFVSESSLAENYHGGILNIHQEQRENVLNEIQPNNEAMETSTTSSTSVISKQTVEQNEAPAAFGSSNVSDSQLEDNQNANKENKKTDCRTEAKGFLNPNNSNTTVVDMECEDAVETSKEKKLKVDPQLNPTCLTGDSDAVMKTVKTAKGRSSCCPVPTCQHSRDRGVRLRSIPSKLHDLPFELKEFIFKEFQINEHVTTCCSSCLIRVRKYIKLQKYTKVVNDEEVLQLKKLIADHGLNWKVLSESLNKSLKDLKLFVVLNKKKLDICKSSADTESKMDFSMNEFSDDESDESRSSSEERDALSSDTASAESPTTPNNKISKKVDNILIPPINQPPKRQKTQEEYDSSATETADEENDVVAVNRSSPQSLQFAFKPANNSRDSNVQDIISNVIEKAIKEQSIGLTMPSMKNAHLLESRQENNFKRDFSGKGTSERSAITPSALTIKSSESLGLVNNHLAMHSRSSVNKAEIHEKPMMDESSSSMFVKNENDSQTLDLTVKKSSKEFFPNALTYSKIDEMKMSSQNHGGHHLNQSTTSYMAMEQPEKNKVVMQPCFSVHSSMEGNSESLRNFPGCHVPFPQQKPKVFSRMSPKPVHHMQVNASKGSITQGTPVSNQQNVSSSIIQARFDNVFRQTLNTNEKTGSITHGTPISVSALSSQNEKRSFEYYNNKSRHSPSSQQGSPQSVVHFSNSSFPRSAYMDHPQLSSKQIMMNDYITSQQLIGQRSNRMEKDSGARSMNNISMHAPAAYYSEKDRTRCDFENRASPNTHTSSPSPRKTPPPPQRQGVIQRHNKPMSPTKNRLTYCPPTYLSGHEAFSSLVDVASNQPHINIPVTKDDARNLSSLLSIENANANVSDEFRYPMPFPMQVQLQHHRLQNQHQASASYLQDFEKEELRRKESKEMENKEKLSSSHSSERDIDKQNSMYAKQEEFERLKSRNAEGDAECKFRPQITSKGDTTFTAANLINAIITHQISQNNNEPPIIRESFRPNSQFISIRENAGNVDMGKPRNSPCTINIESEGDNPATIVNKIKFGELADSIINKDFAPSNQLRIPNVLSSQYQEVTAGGNVSESQWKSAFNKRLSSKEGIENMFLEDKTGRKTVFPASPRCQSLIEPISPPDASLYEKRNHNSEFALDCYVKSRIAEAMRTENDKRNVDEQDLKMGSSSKVQVTVGKDSKMLMISEDLTESDSMKESLNEKQTAPVFSSTAYTYPYSALSMSKSSSSGLSINTASLMQTQDKPNALVSNTLSNVQKLTQDEPKPLLSSKYEALSDED